MKHFPIESPGFIMLEQGFGQWLDVLGYAPATVKGLPGCVRAFFHYLESQNQTSLEDITRTSMRQYFYYHLSTRENQLYKTGSLSAAHLNKHLQGLERFCDYLRQSGIRQMPALDIMRLETGVERVNWLTRQEVGKLYTAADAYPQDKGRKPSWLYPVLALRDKAMLGVYYGCGLRCNEGLKLMLSDVLWDKGVLHVRKGKNYKERLVPMSKGVKQDLENWVYDGRPWLLKKGSGDAFFINERGAALQGQMLLLRLKLLVCRTQDAVVADKSPGLHTLRHSIATHLLSAGMELERIRDFLGHTSLESTQIYAHLLEDGPFDDVRSTKQ